MKRKLSALWNIFFWLLWKFVCFYDQCFSDLRFEVLFFFCAIKFFNFNKLELKAYMYLREVVWQYLDSPTKKISNATITKVKNPRKIVKLSEQGKSFHESSRKIQYRRRNCVRRYKFLINGKLCLECAIHAVWISIMKSIMENMGIKYLGGKSWFCILDAAFAGRLMCAGQRQLCGLKHDKNRYFS